MDSRTWAKIGLGVLGVIAAITVTVVVVKSRKEKKQMVEGGTAEMKPHPNGNAGTDYKTPTSSNNSVPTNTVNVKTSGYPKWGKVTAENGMYAREAPATSSKAITTLLKGQQISITGESGAFYRTFLTRSDRGVTEVYVGKKYVQLV